MKAKFFWIIGIYECEVVILVRLSFFVGILIIAIEDLVISLMLFKEIIFNALLFV
jgi:hypothetical protein